MQAIERQNSKILKENISQLSKIEKIHKVRKKNYFWVFLRMALFEY
jgi:hypothetical protein